MVMAPNRNLADTWTLLNAVEFHALDGWSYSRTALNAFGVRPALTANGWGAQTTQTIESTCYVSNDKFTDVTNDGYLRMWAANDPGTATAGTGDKSRTFGAAALYANKIGTNTTVPQHTVITVGTRIEVRARIRGALQGFNYAIWLMGNSNNGTTDWPECGEIDIMENPVPTPEIAAGHSDLSLNTVHQTLHYGVPVDEVHANPTVNNVIQPSEWNIYWVEIVDENTINVGINGVTTRTFTSSDNSYEWAFNREVNPNGLHILLTAGLAAEWTLEEVNEGGWADPEFLGLTYEESKTSDLTPRMEIDWIRLWINENYTTDGAGGVNPNGKFF